MKAKLYQITPYNINDNNFYNFKSQLSFNQFIDKTGKPIEKDVSIVKLESYNKIMYKLKFENENEEKTFYGFKYMIVDNKYWFITNFEINKNNNSGFITYYAQLDHWATQWLTVKKHIHNNIQEKSLYIERLHQNRWYYKNNILYLNFKHNSPFHQEEKIKINNYYPVRTYKIKTIDLIKDYEPKLTISNKCYYFLRIQLNRPLTFYNYCRPQEKSYTDFCYNYIFIPLTDENMHYYLDQFNPNYMNVFSVIDKKIDLSNYQRYFKSKIHTDTQMKDYYDAIKKNNFEIIDNEYFLPDVTFYKLMNKDDSFVYDELDIKDTDLIYDFKNNLILRNYEEPILKCYPYTKYIYNKGNNFKEYKINELLYDENENEKIKMKYFSSIIYDIYSVWIFPITGIFKNIKEREFLPYSLNIIINMEIPTTSNSFTTYAQNNLNTLQTNINQAEQTRQLSNVTETTGLISSIATIIAGTFLAPVTGGISTIIAGAGAAALYGGAQMSKWASNLIINDFPVDSLNSKISDMKNNPNLISAVSNNYYWLTYFNNEYNIYDVCENYKKPNTSRFLVSSITPSEQKILSDWYYYNGYLFNRYSNELNFDEKRNRYILNFYKIKDIKIILSSCAEICNEDIEWWNNTFQQGIIVWETEDPLNLYNQQIYIGNNKYENWEIELLNNNYFLQKIKTDKINQEKIQQDNKAGKFLSDIVKKQKGGE